MNTLMGLMNSLGLSRPNKIMIHKMQNRKDIKNYTPTVVLIGRTGVGKTTLANMLCDTTHEAGQGMDSVTRNLFRNPCAVSSKPFNIIDTPGADSKKETYKHAVLLLKGLTAVDINTIFIVTKYDSRWSRIKDDYEYVLDMVYKYEKKIVVMISHWEQCENPTEAFPKICEMFEDCANVISYSNQSKSQNLADLMYSCVCNMEPQKLEIPDEDFILRFNVAEMVGNMKKQLDNYKREIKKLRLNFEKLVEEYANIPTEDKDDYLLMLNFNFNEELEKFKSEFQSQHCNTMNSLNDYTLYIELTEYNINISDEFSIYISKRMSYNPNDTNDPRNFIKKCPHCGEIWFRTQGCDGKTTCGNLPGSKDDQYQLFRRSKTFFKYVLVKFGDIFLYKLNPPTDATNDSRIIEEYKVSATNIENQRQESIVSSPNSAIERDSYLTLQYDKFKQELENLVDQFKRTYPIEMNAMNGCTVYPKIIQLNKDYLEEFLKNIIVKMSQTAANRLGSARSVASATPIAVRPRGCGKPIVFKELPKVEDKIIFELFKVRTIDEAKEIIKEERFQTMRALYERSIDFEFHD